MEVRINGDSEVLDEKISIKQLIKKKGQNPGKVIVVYNGEVLNRSKWSETVLENQDDLEVLRFVGGG